MNYHQLWNLFAKFCAALNLPHAEGDAKGLHLAEMADSRWTIFRDLPNGKTESLFTGRGMKPTELADRMRFAMACLGWSDIQADAECARKARDILYPPGKEDAQWDSGTIEEVADALHREPKS